MRVEPLAPGERRAKTNLQTVSLAELGDRLPFGGPEGRELTLRPPVFGVRKKQGAVKGRKDLQRHPGRLTIAWLLPAIASLQGQPVEAEKEPENALRLSRLSFGDVLYVMMRWQVLSYPEGWPIGDATCGLCGGELRGIRVDLNEIPITALPEDGVEAPTIEVGLRRGFAVGSRGTVKALRLRPPSWTAVYNLGTEGWANGEVMRSKLLADAICGTDIEGLERVPEEALDNLWPEDLTILDEALETITPTPDMEIEVDCPHCQGKNSTKIDWKDPGFFSPS